MANRQRFNGVYKSGSFLQYKKTLVELWDGAQSVNRLLLTADGTLLAATNGGLMKLSGEKLEPLFEGKFSGSVSTLVELQNGTVAVCDGKKISYIIGKKVKVVREFESEIVDICAYNGELYIMTLTHIIITDLECKKDKLVRGLEGGNGLCLAVGEGGIYAATENSLSIIHGKRLEWKNIMPRFCQMPDHRINSLAFDGAGYLWLSTNGGAVIHDNMSLWLTPEKVASLPKNAVYKTVCDGVGGKYFASDVGVIYQKNGKLKYFSADRWVPSNKINDIAVKADGSVFFAATECGLAKIEACEMTLLEKADFYEAFIEKHHTRRGFIASAEYDDVAENAAPVISDNDGLWTACNVAAESFRYAATGDKEALEKARRGVKAMLLLTRITGIDGFTARAVRYEGDKGFGDGNKEWVKTPDGKCEWKCETSSDEMTGHFFGMSIYYDLCADESEKKEIETALCKITDHILENGFRLIDHDGLPTTWACWDPQLLNYNDKWVAERGINSLELLGFLKVSYHISGNEKYKKKYDELVAKHHYPLNVVTHKFKDAHICHIDDNLGFLAMLTLLRLEENESLRSLYLCGMEDHWEYERVEKQPLFCIIHAVFSGRDTDLLEGVQSLREMPLDLRMYGMYNSNRKDIVYDTEQEEWFESPLPKNPLPFDERNIHRPDGSAFQLNDRNHNHILEGTVFLLPYWIARYYGLIEE